MIMVLGPHKKKADAKIDADAARATKAQARADAQGRGGRRARGSAPRRPGGAEEGARPLREPRSRDRGVSEATARSSR